MRCVTSRQTALAVAVTIAAAGMLCVLSPMVLEAQTAMPGAGRAQMGTASNVGTNAWIYTKDVATTKPVMVTGSIQMKVADVTVGDTANSGDAATVVSMFSYPQGGSQYTVQFDAIRPIGTTMPHYGGVAILKPVFGKERFGGMSIPETFAYMAAFGNATIMKDGKTIARNQLAAALVTQALHNEQQGWLSAPDPVAQEIHLLVPGSIAPDGTAVPGFPNGFFYVYWQSAAFELAGVGGVVSTTKVGATPRPPSGRGPGAVPTISISLTDSGIRKKIGQAPSGLYDVKVTNNSSRSMGIVYTGTDLCCTKYVRFSDLTRPGKSQVFRWYFAPGKVSIHTYLKAKKVREGYTNVKYAPFNSSIVFN